MTYYDVIFQWLLDEGRVNFHDFNCCDICFAPTFVLDNVTLFGLGSFDILWNYGYMHVVDPHLTMFLDSHFMVSSLAALFSMH